jgi:hypothetical protein
LILVTAVRMHLCEGILVLSVLYVPANVYWHSQTPGLGFELSTKNVIFGILFMSPFQLIGWMFLLKTNNPITRYNPFSVNPKWDGKMKGSLEENPGQMFEMDAPDENELKRVNRNKRLDQLLK